MSQFKQYEVGPDGASGEGRSWVQYSELRPVVCEICRKSISVGWDPIQGYLPGMGHTRAVPIDGIENLEGMFWCQSCDIRMCAKHIKWVRCREDDPAVVAHREQMAKSGSALGKATVNMVSFPSCPRCGKELSGWTHGELQRALDSVGPVGKSAAAYDLGWKEKAKDMLRILKENPLVTSSDADVAFRGKIDKLAAFFQSLLDRAT